MYVKCLDEYRARLRGRPVTFEETASFGYVYEVDKKVGEKLIATGKFAACTEEEARSQDIVPIVPPDLEPEPEPELAILPTSEAEPELTDSEPEAGLEENPDESVEEE